MRRQVMHPQDHPAPGAMNQVRWLYGGNQRGGAVAAGLPDPSLTGPQRIGSVSRVLVGSGTNQRIHDDAAYS